MDDELRKLERAWRETSDPLVGARLLHARRLSPAEVLRDELFSDEGVRRAFATSLPEGDPLRAFVLAQLALAGDGLSCDERSRLTLLETELLETHGIEWTSPRAKCVRWATLPDGEPRMAFESVLGDDGWSFSKGRAERLPDVALASDLVEKGAAVFGPGPVPPVCIEGLFELAAVHPSRHQFVTSRYGSEWTERLAKSEVLARIHDLALWSYNLGDAHTRVFLESPHLANLRKLELVCFQQTAEALEPIARSPRFSQLRELSFARSDDQDGRSRLGDELAALLAGADHLARLESLAIPFAGLTAKGVLELLRSPRLPALRHLDVSENELGTGGMEELAREGQLSRLRSLDVSFCASAAELAPLLGAEALHGIEELAIGNIFGLDRRPDVSRSELPKLRSLDLSLWPIDVDVARKLGEIRAPRLRSLSLDMAKLDDAFATLCATPLFSRIEELVLRGTDVTDRGLEALAACEVRLRWLRLGSPGRSTVTNDGVVALLRSPVVETLNVLDIDELYGLDERFARELVGSPRLFEVRGHDARDAGEPREILRSRWGDRVITYRHG